MKERQYKMYFDRKDPDSKGFYLADYVGIGKGHINTGAIVLSNTTKGLGNLTGFIHPQKVGVFQLIEKDVFVSTCGCQMTFQNSIGQNDLTYIQGFIEYILQKRLQSIEGDEYQGIQKNKAYLVTYTTDDGQSGNATMTNSIAPYIELPKHEKEPVGRKTITFQTNKGPDPFAKNKTIPNSEPPANYRIIPYDDDATKSSPAVGFGEEDNGKIIRFA